MLDGFPQLHLSGVLPELQRADSLGDVGLQGTDVHKHTGLQGVKRKQCPIFQIQQIYSIRVHCMEADRSSK